MFGLLLEDVATGIVVTPWVDIATRLGVPTALLAFVVWYHVRMTREHAVLVKEKDLEIARLNKEHDGEIARIVKEYSSELSRVNEQRVKESQEMTSRMFQRDNTAMDILTETDKTLTLIMEKLR